MKLCWQIYGTSFITNNDLAIWVVKRFITQKKGTEINWATTLAWMAKEKCYKMEVLAFRSKGIDLNGPCLSQKLSTDGDSTKNNVHLVSDFKMLKVSCNISPYSVVTNDLKQVEDLVSFLNS